MKAGMVFFYVFCCFFIFIYIYTGIRLIPSLVTGKKRVVSAWIILFFLLTALILHFYFLATLTQFKTAKSLAWIGYTGFGVIAYLFCLVLIRDIAAAILSLTLKVKKRLAVPRPPVPENAGRRIFLFKASGYSIAALAGSVSVAGFTTALREPRVVRVDIPVKNRHRGLKGLTIAQFTDLHISETITYPYVKRVCDKINGLNADMIVFTGDLADGLPRHLARDASGLADLQAPLGKYFVTGNHEYYFGAVQWIGMAEKLGFEPLLNAHRVIEYNQAKLSLAGVTDIRAGAFFKTHASNPEKAIQGCPEDSFKLLLAHQPTSVYQAAELGFDLQLSGHTHGGQSFPFNLLIRLEHPFVKGLFRYKKTRLYVSQGTGYWGPPLRLGTFPEITLIRFV